MIETVTRNLVFLSSSHIYGSSGWDEGYEIPLCLQGVQGVRWFLPQGPLQLKQFLQSQDGEVFVVIRVKHLTERVLQAFLSWNRIYLKLSFIFVAEVIENAVHQVGDLKSRLLLFYESEGERISKAVTRRLLGFDVRSRRQERKLVQVPVMLKKSITEEKSPTGKGVQFLKEGQMRDFSKGGAQIELGQTCVRLRDFISIMYQNRNGEWVSVESQVRWVVSTSQGQQLVGVQFLAVSA